VNLSEGPRGFTAGGRGWDPSLHPPPGPAAATAPPLLRRAACICRARRSCWPLGCPLGTAAVGTGGRWLRRRWARAWPDLYRRTLLACLLLGPAAGLSGCPAARRPESFCGAARGPCPRPSRHSPRSPAVLGTRVLCRCGSAAPECAHRWRAPPRGLPGRFAAGPARAVHARTQRPRERSDAAAPPQQCLKRAAGTSRPSTSRPGRWQPHQPPCTTKPATMTDCQPRRFPPLLLPPCMRTDEE
jgi:hypothetical protein